MTEQQGAAAEAAGETQSASGEVQIEAPIEAVWEALTDAAELERWFPLEAAVEPGPRGKIFMSWKNEFAGTSEILSWDPPHHLQTTWGYGPDPAQVTDYWLEAAGGRTILRVVTSGFPRGEPWDAWAEGTRRGWAFELRSLKEYLEHNRGQDRAVAYVRRRTPLDYAEAWARLERSAAETRPPGDPFDVHPPVQYAAVLAEPAGSLFRLSLEPCAPGISGVDVTLWLSVWGAAAAKVPELRTKWQAMLTEVFPEGHAL